jgi:hypothetical protein
MPNGNMFNSSHHHKIASTAVTVQEQGGGEKKAGFPYIVGRDTQTSIAFKNSGNYTLRFLMKTFNPKTNFSRPISSFGTAGVNTAFKANKNF